MSNEKDVIRIDPAAQQFAEMLVSLFEPAIKIMADAKAMAGQPAPDDNIVNMSMTREAFEKQRAEYNKLWKQHTACKNQRDSYAATIANKDKVIAELNATIAELKKQPQTPCAVLLIDSIVYTPEEVKKIVAVSADRAREIERLTRDLTTMTSLRNNAVKDSERLVAENEDLRSRVKAFYYNGKVISDERLKQLCDLGGVAEEEGLTKASIRNLKKLAARSDGQISSDENPLVTFERGCIVIHNVSNAHLELCLNENQTLSIDAALIPQMVEDIKAAQNKADRLESDLGRCMERNNQQAVALRAANRRISDLQGTVQELNTRISDKDADVQRLTIERNLVRGQLNELRALKTPATVNDQVLQAGEAYMTTALGMLPINSEGMRKLSDALDTYRAKVASLTKGFQEWIKA